MVVLDTMIVNVALPTIQASVGLQSAAASTPGWSTATALTFGALLLLGGRSGDLLGRAQRVHGLPGGVRGGGLDGRRAVIITGGC